MVKFGWYGTERIIFTSLMGLNIYGFISAGWASNSKYSFLGAIRASAQM